jgi:hypothetical protein
MYHPPHGHSKMSEPTAFFPPDHEGTPRLSGNGMLVEMATKMESHFLDLRSATNYPHCNSLS